MTDPRIERLAKTLVEYSTDLQPGDRVAIIGGPLSEPLMRETYRAALRAGAHPQVFMGRDVYLFLGGMDDIFFAEASDEQLEHVQDAQKLVFEQFEAMISIRSQSNTRSLSRINPARQTLYNQAHRQVSQTYFDRGATGEFKWVGTLYPTQAYAQDAEMSLQEFEQFVYSATLSDQEDPLAGWREVHVRQQRLVDWLNGKSQVEVRGPNVDMRLSVSGRKFINSSGTHNMPSGEIFTGPVEESVEGWVRFSYPAVLRGVEVEGVELTFDSGRVSEASAVKNEAFLLSMLNSDEGARYLGEWAIGTNDNIKRFTKNILFDEKLGGTIHMALGRGYPETGSVNQSSIHWDMICDMKDGGQIVVDGQLIYESGEFKI